MAFPSIRSQRSTSGPTNQYYHHSYYPTDIGVGDTLLCIVSSDGDNTFDWANATGSTSGGWTKLYEVSSSDSQVCLSVGLAKADGDELSTSYITVSCTSNEKTVSRMFCLQDAEDPDWLAPVVSADNSSAGSTTVTFLESAPEALVDSQLVTGGSAADIGYNAANLKFATEITGDHTLDRVVLSLQATGSPTDNLLVKIFTDNSGEPSTTQVGGTGTLDQSTITTGSYNEYTITLASPATLVTSNTYWLEVSRSGSVSTTNFVSSQGGTASPAKLSKRYATDAWINYASDLWFKALLASPVTDYFWLIAAGYDDDDGGMTTNYPTNYQTNAQYDKSDTASGSASLDTSWRLNDIDQHRATSSGGDPLGRTATFADDRRAIQVTSSADTDADAVTLWLRTQGTPTDDVLVKIFTDNGGEPSTTQVGGTGTKPASELDTVLTPYKIALASAASLTASTTYWLVLERSGALNDSNYYQFTHTQGTPGEVSMYEQSGTWSASTSDPWFILHGDGVATSEDPGDGTAITAEEWVSVVIGVFPVLDAGGDTHQDTGADTVEMSDSATFDHTLAGSGADTADLTDSATTRLDATEAASDTTDLSDSATSILTALESGSDTAELSDSATAVLTARESVSEQVDLTDSAESIALKINEGSEGVDLSDTAATVLTAVEAPSEQVDLSDTGTVVLTIPGAGVEGADLSDQATGILTSLEGGTEGVELSDSATATAVKSSTASDIAELSDSATASLIVPVSGTDTVDLSDEGTTTHQIVESVSDALDLSDAATVLHKVVESVSDTVDLSDSGAPATTIPVSAADTVEMSDSATEEIVGGVKQESGSDAAELSDTGTTRLDAVESASDTTDLSDSAAAVLTALESGTEGVELSDSAVDARFTPGSGTEVVDLSDSATGSLTLPLSGTESVELSDSATARLVAVEIVSDVVEVGEDTATVLDATESVTDGVVLSDLGEPGGAAAGSDAAELSDSATATMTAGESAADAAELSESTVGSSIGFEFDGEQAVFSDSATADIAGGLKEEDGADTAEFSDSATAIGTFSKAVSDGLVAGDSATVTATWRTIGEDAAKLSDSAAAVGTWRIAPEDTAKLSDSATATVILRTSTQDGTKLSDSATAHVIKSVSAADGLKLSDSATSVLIQSITTLELPLWALLDPSVTSVEIDGVTMSMLDNSVTLYRLDEATAKSVLDDPLRTFMLDDERTEE